MYYTKERATAQGDFCHKSIKHYMLFLLQFIESRYANALDTLSPG